ncbi:hypothetical protein CYMTET_23829, partial [Cymbomonas tetramitiformis]
EDEERQSFKIRFFKALFCRCEALLVEGREVVLVGDLNIAPRPIDTCSPGPGFEAVPWRVWLASVLRGGGGPFIDVFREFHPGRRQTMPKGIRIREGCHHALGVC